MSGPTDITLVIDDDGSGTMTGAVPECDERDDSSCRTFVSPDPASSSLALPVGDALRADGHGDPLAAIVTGSFDWRLDEGAPRPARDSFVVRQSTVPWQLLDVPMSPALRQPTWTSATPAATTLPTVHFIQVAAADECNRPAE